jgi:hypothetical protein
VSASFLENNEMKSGPKADKATKSSAVKIDGKKIHYLTAGQGPAVVLLHGYTQTSRMWRPLIEKLKNRFTVIAPDLPGIGDSDIPKNGCDMKTAAIRIHALAKSIGVTKARVVGHDIGLMVAYAYAAQFPTEVEKPAFDRAGSACECCGKALTWSNSQSRGGGRGQWEAHHGSRFTPVILCCGGAENCHLNCGP